MRRGRPTNATLAIRHALEIDQCEHVLGRVRGQAPERLHLNVPAEERCGCLHVGRSLVPEMLRRGRVSAHAIIVTGPPRPRQTIHPMNCYVLS